MVQKVVTKGNLHYRKLTDKPESEAMIEPHKEDLESLKRLAQGNKVLLPVFSFSGAEVIQLSLEEGVGGGQVNGEVKEEVEQKEVITAVVDGQVVDVRQIKEQLEKAEKAKMAAEANVNVLKNSLSNLISQTFILKLIFIR
jgi:hypothetical protein